MREQRQVIGTWPVCHVMFRVEALSQVGRRSPLWIGSGRALEGFEKTERGASHTSKKTNGACAKQRSVRLRGEVDGRSDRSEGPSSRFRSLLRVSARLAVVMSMMMLIILLIMPLMMRFSREASR